MSRRLTATAPCRLTARPWFTTTSTLAFITLGIGDMAIRHSVLGSGTGTTAADTVAAITTGIPTAADTMGIDPGTAITAEGFMAVIPALAVTTEEDSAAATAASVEAATAGAVMG